MGGSIGSGVDERRVTSVTEGTPAAFRFFPVGAPLDAYVEHLYTSVVTKQFMFRVEATRLPELEAQVVFVIEDGRGSYPNARRFSNGYASLFLQPAHLRTVPVSDTLREAVGAALRPSGLRLLLSPGSADLSRAPCIALEEVCGPGAAALLDRLMAAHDSAARLAILHAYLDARARRLGEPNLAGARALALLREAHGELSVETLARLCGTTSRTLRNTLSTETGLAPKHLARVLRIRRALKLLVEANTPLSGTALASAFSDQAHMCREFRALLGTPPALLERRIHQTHDDIPRLRTQRKLIATGLLLLPRSLSEPGNPSRVSP